MSLQNILVDITEERQRQREKWGTQRHDFSVWHVVLAEETGELAERILDYRHWKRDVEQGRILSQELAATSLKRMREEAIQCAAVAVSMIEHIDEELAQTR